MRVLGGSPGTGLLHLPVHMRSGDDGKPGQTIAPALVHESWVRKAILVGLLESCPE